MPLKQSLFAYAALSIFAGSAYAQSGLTIYGVVDVGYINAKTNGSGNNADTQASTNVMGNSAEQTSRLGFKGNEDFGNGMVAFFTAETDLQPSNASLSTWQSRQAFAGIGKAGIGQLAFGTQYTPIFNQLSASDVGNTNNMPGSAVYPVYSAGSSTAGGAFSDNAGVGGISNALTVRTQSTLSLQTANLAGFKISGIYTLRNDTLSQNKSGTLAVSNNYTGWGLSTDYTWKRLYVGLAYQSLKSNNLGQGTCTATQIGAGNANCSSTAFSPTPRGWTTASGGVNTQDNQYYGALTYDFELLKIYFQYVNRKAINTIDSNYFASRTAQQIGMRLFFTSSIESWANIGNGKHTNYGNNAISSGFSAWQLGLNYYFSKRTNLYAIYGSETEAANAVNSNTAANGFALGVRTLF